MYQRLDPDRIVATSRQLARRVEERFPGSGLGRVSAELVQVTERAAADTVWLGRPHRGLRIGIWALIGFLLIAVIGAAVTLLPEPGRSTLSEVLQAVESAVNDLVFLGIAVWFLLSLETRWKRRRALDSLHRLRAMAHIIDMHQLTKDPERVIGPDAGPDTPSSPARSMTAFELSRYLDYASEMLSLLGKAAALYLQDFDDPVAIATVNEIESLTTGLSRKIWQKIMIIDRVVG
ncbi:MAG: hypothetical protein AB7R55_01285 [Gemmatimonadales bacterium]